MNPRAAGKLVNGICLAHWIIKYFIWQVNPLFVGCVEPTSTLFGNQAVSFLTCCLFVLWMTFFRPWTIVPDVVDNWFLFYFIVLKHFEGGGSFSCIMSSALQEIYSSLVSFPYFVC